MNHLPALPILIPLFAAAIVLFFEHRRFGMLPQRIVAWASLAACALAAVLLPPGPFFVLLGLSAGMFFPGAYVTATRQMGDHPNVAPSILAAGQVPERGLADQLLAVGVTPHVIGGADVAAELDAKRAIDQAARLAATL